MSRTQLQTDLRPVISRQLPAAVRPVMPNEERYALAETFTEANVTTPFATRLKGRLDVARLRDAVERFGDRHAAFQSGFRARPDGGWESFLVPEAKLSLEVRRMTGASFADVAKAIEPELFAPTDMTRPPLARFLLVEVAEGDHWFINSLHHTINDGRSEVLLRDEVFALYVGRDLPPPPPPMSAVAREDWRTSPRVVQALDYWRATLADVDATATLPVERAGPMAPNGLIVEILTDDQAAAIRAAAKAIDVTMFEFIYAAGLVALTRLVDRPRLASAFQSAGRLLFPGAEDTLGVFTNALMIAPTVEPEASFEALAHAVRADVRAALANEAAPYHEVIRATGVHAVVGFNKFPVTKPIEVPGLAVSAPEPLPRQYEYDFNLRLLSGDGGYRLVNYYRVERYSEALARTVTQRIAALALAFAADPGAVVATIPSEAPLAAPAEAAPPDTAEPIFGAFLARAAERPEAAALTHDGATTSYGALEAASRRLAQRLLAAGIGPGDPVMVLADRSPRVVTAMIGVARAGGVIAVCDNSYPESRLAMLGDIARPRLLLWAGIDDKPSGTALSLAGSLGVPVLAVTAPDASPDLPLPRIDPDATAYYLFTSGSTGQPKCVAAAHRPLANFVAWQAARFELTRDDRFTMLSGLSHDPLMRDIFTPLSLGAELLIPRQEQLFEPRGLSAWCAAARPTVMHLTPPLGRLLVAGAPADLRLPLRHVFWGGDLLRPDLTRALRALAPGVVNVNFYGATETPQAAAFFVDDDPSIPWRTLPVGRGSARFDVSVRDAAGGRKAIGEIGEVVVASPLLSQGYVEQGRIREAAIGGVYRTGDRGFHLPSGDVMLVGRADDQVKIRGYRVELAEATALVEASPLVESAAVLATEADAPDAERRLIAHVVPAAGAPSAPAFEAALLGELGARLPSHMMPQRLNVIDRLPLLPNGKLDRRALVAAGASLATVTQPERASANPAERELMARWAQVLGRPVRSSAESFATLSGDSLSFVQAYLALEEIAGTVPEGWQFMPIHALVRDTGSGEARPVRRGRVIDMAMLIRAVAIVFVVGWHFSVVDYNRGITSALVLASGMLFGAFQLSDSLARRTPAPILGLVGRILVPVMLFTVALFAAKTWAGKDPDLSILLLYTDFIDFSRLTPAEWERQEVVLWYIHCLVHILLFLAAAVWLAARWRPAKLQLFEFALAIFAVGCVTRFILPAVGVPGWFAGDAPGQHSFSYLPTTHIATFMLGSLIIAADTPQRRRIALVALLLFAAATGWFYATLAWTFLLIAGLAQLFKPHIRLPRLAAQLVFLLAGSSLFIYLTHVQLFYLLKQFSPDGFSVFGALLALVLGVIAKRVWDWLAARALHWRRPATSEVAAESI